MYHSVSFFPDGQTQYTTGAGFNTWDSFKLIPVERPIMPAPELSYPNFSRISDIDYLGLTSNYGKRGIPVSRKVSWTFYSYHVITTHDKNWNQSSIDTTVNSSTHMVPNLTVNPDKLRQFICEKLSGKVCIIRLEDEGNLLGQNSNDPYYVGLVEVKDWKTEEHFSTVTFDITAEPYRFGREVVVEYNPSELGGYTYNMSVYGTAVTPTRVEITPTRDLLSLTLTGFAYDKYSGRYRVIVISNVHQNKTIVIDGRQKVCLEDELNKMSETSLMAFPSLAPLSSPSDTHTLQTDSLSLSKIKVIYDPRYL